MLSVVDGARKLCRRKGGRQGSSARSVVLSLPKMMMMMQERCSIAVLVGRKPSPLLPALVFLYAAQVQEHLEDLLSSLEKHRYDMLEMVDQVGWQGPRRSRNVIAKIQWTTQLNSVPFSLQLWQEDKQKKRRRRVIRKTKGLHWLTHSKLLDRSSILPDINSCTFNVYHKSNRPPDLVTARDYVHDIVFIEFPPILM